MKKMFWIGAINLGLVASTLCANQVPQQLHSDSRIKVVAYDANNVVTVNGNHLISTTIELNTDEHILSVVNGDELAWALYIDKNVPHLLHLKPILPSSDTNMMVFTNKRHYQFHLLTHPSDLPNSSHATYWISFKYPELEQAQLESEIRDLSAQVGNTDNGNLVRWNYNYAFVGNKDIAPVQALDNGTFTVFKFPHIGSIPAIFSVDHKRQEALLNFRVQGDYVFIQGVHHQYTLRNGDTVTTVYNDNCQSI